MMTGKAVRRDTEEIRDVRECLLCLYDPLVRTSRSIVTYPRSIQPTECLSRLSALKVETENAIASVEGFSCSWGTG